MQPFDTIRESRNGKKRTLPELTRTVKKCVPREVQPPNRKKLARMKGTKSAP